MQCFSICQQAQRYMHPAEVPGYRHWLCMAWQCARHTATASAHRGTCNAISVTTVTDHEQKYTYIAAHKTNRDLYGTGTHRSMTGRAIGYKKFSWLQLMVAMAKACMQCMANLMDAEDYNS